MVDLVTLEHRDGVCILSLNRPEKLNAVNQPMIEALNSALEQALACPEDRVLLLRGEGRAFSAGNDLEASASQAGDDLNPEFIAAYAQSLQAISHKLLFGEKPVVGAIQGWAVGAGFEWALNCDLTVWAESARAFFPELRLGLFPTGGVLSLLPRTVGLARARELFLLGDKFDARQLESMGLVNRVVPDEQLDGEALALAQRLLELPAATVARWKKTFVQAACADIEGTLTLEAEALAAAILQQASGE